MNAVPIIKATLTYKNGNENKCIKVLLLKGEATMNDKDFFMRFTTENHKDLFIKYDDFISLEEI